MHLRPLGQTGLHVSFLSFGASSLGGVFKPIDDVVAVQTVHTALDLGINFIDVAPYYGLTKAETVLGKALASVPRDRYHLATKVGRYGQSEFDFSAPRTLASVDQSLARLGVDHIDLIQVHDMEFGDLDEVIDETLPALDKLRRQGKVRFIGVTGYPLKIFPYVLDRSTVKIDTVLSYCRYTLNDASLQNLLPDLKRRQLGVLNAAPLAMALLTTAGPPAWHPAPPMVREACAKAAAHCAAKGSDIAKLAIQFAVANPEIDTTIVGTADPAEIRRNVEWAAAPIDPTLLHEVQQILRPIQNFAWPTGRPENN